VTLAGQPLAFRWELARKALHMAWVAVPVAYALGTPRSVVLLGLAIACTIAVIIEVVRSRSRTASAAFQRATGVLLRQHEHHKWSGATWLLLSFLLVVLLFDTRVAIAAMWAVAVGDATATIVGRTVGRHRIGRSPKTIEGSAACVLAAAVGAWMVADLDPGLSVVAGITAGIAEWPSAPLDDNLRIGLGVGGGILLCRMVFS
jgi:dolichol kinase